MKRRLIKNIEFLLRHKSFIEKSIDNNNESMLNDIPNGCSGMVFCGIPGNLISDTIDDINTEFQKMRKQLKKANAKKRKG